MHMELKLIEKYYVKNLDMFVLVNTARCPAKWRLTVSSINGETVDDPITGKLDRLEISFENENKKNITLHCSHGIKYLWLEFGRALLSDEPKICSFGYLNKVEFDFLFDKQICTLSSTLTGTSSIHIQCTKNMIPVYNVITDGELVVDSSSRFDLELEDGVRVVTFDAYPKNCTFVLSLHKYGNVHHPNILVHDFDTVNKDLLYNAFDMISSNCAQYQPSAKIITKYRGDSYVSIENDVYSKLINFNSIL